MPDWSEAATDATLRSIRGVADRLEALDGLDDESARDRRLLVAELRYTALEWEELRAPLTSPMSWIYTLDPDLYLKRRYAPAEERAEAVITLLDSAGSHLDLARGRLDEVLPRVGLSWGIDAAQGLAELLRSAVAFDELDPDSQLAARLASAAAAAADELDSFGAWLESERLPQADDSYPIGAGNLERLVALGELVDMSIADLEEMARANLAENLAAFRETAGRLDPSKSPREVYDEHVAAVHPPRGGLVSAAETMLEDIRSFLIERDLITVPSEVRALVAATPKHLRWAFAMMDTPGPYETVAKEAFYYVTPDEPDWSDDKAEEWLRALNTFALEDISIHETYPGHYVHFLHYDSAPTEVSRRLASYAFTEGWAHYTEQMMWEAGYRQGDARFRLAQLAEALVRNCRFVCSLGLHAGDMTVDEATETFVRDAYYEALPARKEAERGTFDPGYFSYTLGKLQILELRDDYRRQQGESYSLKSFHDELLSRGAPPVAIMREIMIDS